MDQFAYAPWLQSHGYLSDEGRFRDATVPTAAQNIRLEICEIDGRFVLFRGAVLIHQLRVFHNGDEGLIVEGLEELIFGDDIGNFRLEYRTTAGRNSRTLFIRGWADGDRSVVVAGESALFLEQMSLLGGTVLAGDVSFGDAFLDRICPADSRVWEREFSLDSADFRVTLCTVSGEGGPGGGRTMPYEFARIRVQDENPTLTADHQREFDLDRSALADRLKHFWNHHNGCDNFVLTLPHVTYAATTAYVPGGCSRMLPEVPVVTRESERKIHFRIKYQGGEWQDFIHPQCAHFLWQGQCSLD